MFRLHAVQFVGVIKHYEQVLAQATAMPDILTYPTESVNKHVFELYSIYEGLHLMQTVSD